MECVNEGSRSFICHQHILSTSGMRHTCLYLFPAADLHCIVASTHVLSCWGLKAELSWVAGYLLRWFACTKMVTHPSTSRTPCRVTSLSNFKQHPVCENLLHECQTFAWRSNPCQPGVVLLAVVAGVWKELL